MSSIMYYFFIFFIYSFLGWVVESLYVSCLEKKFINRGFLIGPYCPIYGFGSLLIISYLSQYKDNMVTVFILTICICCFLEYITSYLLEKLFKARWWDYSNKKFNLNGRICGENAILFGIGGLIVIYIVNPIVNDFINKCNMKFLNILAIIFLIIYVIDLITSFNIIYRLKKNLNKAKIKKDSTQELRGLVLEIINNKLDSKKLEIGMFQKRIIKAFPNIDIYKFNNNRKLFRK